MTPDRRELIAAAALVAPLALPSLAHASVESDPQIVLFDARYGEGRRFARELQRSGAIALETNRDTAALCYGALRKAVRAHPGLRIAGLATHADFQVIWGCAAEARLELTHHAIHNGRGGLSHRTLRGGRQAADLTAAGVAWPEVLAASLAGFRAGPPPLPSTERSYPGTLVSWMIT